MPAAASSTTCSPPTRRSLSASICSARWKACRPTKGPIATYQKHFALCRTTAATPNMHRLSWIRHARRSQPQPRLRLISMRSLPVLVKSPTRMLILITRWPGGMPIRRGFQPRFATGTATHGLIMSITSPATTRSQIQPLTGKAGNVKQAGDDLAEASTRERCRQHCRNRRASRCRPVPNALAR